MAGKAKRKEESAAVIPKRAEVDEFTRAMQREAEEGLAFIERLEIQKDADRDFASNALAEIAQRHDVIEAKRLSWVQPLKAVTNDIDATFRPATKALKRAIEILKGKIGAWDVLQAQERAKLLQASVKAAAAGEQAAAARAYQKAEDFAPADGGASSKLVWTGDVADAALIPREYLIPDVAKLEALTKAMDRDPQIPGWRAFQVAVVRTSRKGAA